MWLSAGEVDDPGGRCRLARARGTRRCPHDRAAGGHSPVRVESEDPAVAELGAPAVRASLLSNLGVQELRRHQTCQDPKTETTEQNCHVTDRVAGRQVLYTTSRGPERRRAKK